MKIPLRKMTISEALRAGIDTEQHILVPESDDISKLPELVEAEIKANKQRTGQQNKSLHKYCSMLSQDLNDSGLDMKKVLKPEIDIPWDKEGKAAKNHLWRPIQIAMGLPDSTADLTTIEVNKVYEVLSRHLSEKFNITTPFPSRFGE